MASEPNPPIASGVHVSSEAAPPGALRRVAARIVWASHVAVVAFILAGWALPFDATALAYAVLAPIVQVGWLVFDYYCWLSIIEARLLRQPLVKPTDDGGEEKRTFVSELVEKLFGVEITNRTSNWISYAVLWGGFAVSVARLTLTE